MDKKRGVSEFLKELKAVALWTEIFFINRPKNSVKHLSEIGITANKRQEIILNLKIEDYSQGPLEETQYGGRDMWVFGKNVNGFEIYIKLTIVDVTNKIVCISFHKAEGPLKYPFK